MRKSIPLVVLAALVVATPPAFAQYQGQDQSKSSAQGYKPSGDTPAQQKERNKDYSKVPGAPGNKSGPPAQQSR
jgi:predicted lipid-binding transport protein (Tim44 family)